MSILKPRWVGLSADITIPCGSAALNGTLNVPAGASAIVVFVHGSGSSRLSPRNISVASYLNEQGLATLLFDLLTREEESVDNVTSSLRFDIKFLAARTIYATEHLMSLSETEGMKLGYFGASTGAAAALVAAAELPGQVSAVVSRGGRPDLAGDALLDVRAPSLFIVGGRDEQVLYLNQQAMSMLKCEKALAIVPGATHLFEEPGTLDQVAELAAKWFNVHLVS